MLLRSTVKRHGKSGVPTRPLIWAMFLLLAVGGGILTFGAVDQSKISDADALVRQIEQAVLGSATTTNIYGGSIMVRRAGRQIKSVTVTGIPSKACVLAGWDLAKKGALAVNGVIPARISAGRLAELCNKDGGASLSWTPHPEE